ncbi:MAG: hypothetical protein V8Q32_02770 [Anaerotignum faecicola]
MNRFLKKICTGDLCGVLGVVSIGAQEAFAADAKEMRRRLDFNGIQCGLSFYNE